MQPRLRDLLQDEPDLSQTLLEDAPHHVTIPPMRTQRDINALLDVPLSSAVSALALKRVQVDSLPSLKAATGKEPSSSSQPSKKTSKASAVPLAEVLNASSPQPRKATHRPLSGYHSDGESGRKRRKLHTDETLTRTLPKPAPASRKGKKRALLPPLLPPLHNPPIGERIIPSMVSDGLVDPLLEIESNLDKESRSLDTAAHSSSTTAKDASQETQKDKGPSRNQTTSEQPLEDVEADEAAPRPGKTGKRSKWTAEETAFLIQGVAKFGIGSWKKILDHPEFAFKDGRNSIDLKDRFRTCFPEEYRQSGSQKDAVKSKADDKESKPKGRGSRTTVELDKMGVESGTPFPKLDRRQRKNFTDEEDVALLRGFKKYGSQWKKIQSDSELGLEHRTRTDLRDRFRNRYPDEFKEAGYTHKMRQKEGEKSKKSGGSADNLAEDGESLATAAEDPNHPLRLFTLGMYDAVDPVLRSRSGSATGDDEDDAGIRLSRNIFDWADRNLQTSKKTAAESSSAAALVAEPRTLSTLDQYHINPLVVHNRLPSLLVPERDAQAQGQGQQSIAPLSRILNATTLEDRPPKDS
jgi:Myb-like DNA-binding domain